MVNSQLDQSFLAYSHPIRRTIVERLADAGSLTVGEATRDCGVSKPAISRHLKVLEEAGTIVRVIDGRTHRLALRRDGLADAQEWLDRHRRLWERKFGVVEEFLNEQRSRPARGEDAQ
jgi:DNA-binding transcriptional ArsR family regulator